MQHLPLSLIVYVVAEVRDPPGSPPRLHWFPLELIGSLRKIVGFYFVDPNPERPYDDGEVFVTMAVYPVKRRLARQQPGEMERRGDFVRIPWDGTNGLRLCTVQYDGEAVNRRHVPDSKETFPNRRVGDGWQEAYAEAPMVGGSTKVFELRNVGRPTHFVLRVEAENVRTRERATMLCLLGQYYTFRSTIRDNVGPFPRPHTSNLELRLWEGRYLPTRPLPASTFLVEEADAALGRAGGTFFGPAPDGAHPLALVPRERDGLRFVAAEAAGAGDILAVDVLDDDFDHLLAANPGGFDPPHLEGDGGGPAGAMDVEGEEEEGSDEEFDVDRFLC